MKNNRNKFNLKTLNHIIHSINMSIQYMLATHHVVVEFVHM